MPPRQRLSELRFDNTVLQQLPLDESRAHGVRQVRGCVYSLVDPTPLAQPQLVAASADALRLLGLDAAEAATPEFTEVMCGNRVLTQQGSRPAAHCYCGYQFGYFAGQLGDGAAIYLGEVVVNSNNNSSSSSADGSSSSSADGSSRQELQLKGAGLTPFSRQADGRKVLRSSMREFLASEAVDALGIPTTRAGSLVVSKQDTVVRDATYSGNAANEPCAVVSRIAPTFIRFGSFEVCKPADSQTGRSGPSAGLPPRQLLLPLVGYVIKSQHPDIWAYYAGGDDVSMAGMAAAQLRDMVETWFAEVCRRTARLAAAWQGVGFVHGVLNTDNMSITGHTLDYGPFGFMDVFDSQHVSNGSDEGARYTYAAQPGICRWNCERLADALQSIQLQPQQQPPAAGAAAGAAAGDEAAAVAAASSVSSLLPPSSARKGLTVYDDEYIRMYRAIMRRKLGLLGRTAATAAATAAAAASGSNGAAASDAATAAGVAGGPPASPRPSWPLAADASAEVVAAAAAVAGAPLQPGAGGLDEHDDRLVSDLLALMEETGADFINTFRRLAMVPLPPPSAASDGNGNTSDAAGAAAAGDAAAAANGASTEQNGGGSSGGGGADGDSDDSFGGFLPLQLSELATPAEMAAGSKPSMPLEQVQMLMMLAGRDTAMLHMLGVNPATLSAQMAKHKKLAGWASMTEAYKASTDATKWAAWLRRYSDRLQREADEGVPAELRVAVMNATNPRVVLRNWVAQTAIRAAELGHYSTVADLLQLLRAPFSSAGDASLAVPPAVAAAAAGDGAQQQQQQGGGEGGAAAAGASCPAQVTLRFDGKPPAWAAKLCVTCSS